MYARTKRNQQDCPDADRCHITTHSQDLALARGFRVSFLSGDVHVAGLGRFCSKPVINLRTDHRFMPQVGAGIKQEGFCPQHAIFIL